MKKIILLSTVALLTIGVVAPKMHSNAFAADCGKCAVEGPLLELSLTCMEQEKTGCINVFKPKQPKPGAPQNECGKCAKEFAPFAERIFSSIKRTCQPAQDAIKSANVPGLKAQLDAATKARDEEASRFDKAVATCKQHNGDCARDSNLLGTCATSVYQGATTCVIDTPSKNGSRNLLNGKVKPEIQTKHDQEAPALSKKVADAKRALEDAERVASNAGNKLGGPDCQGQWVAVRVEAKSCKSKCNIF